MEGCPGCESSLTAFRSVTLGKCLGALSLGMGVTITALASWLRTDSRRWQKALQDKRAELLLTFPESCPCPARSGWHRSVPAPCPAGLRLAVKAMCPAVFPASELGTQGRQDRCRERGATARSRDCEGNPEAGARAGAAEENRNRKRERRGMPGRGQEAGPPAETGARASLPLPAPGAGPRTRRCGHRAPRRPWDEIRARAHRSPHAEPRPPAVPAPGHGRVPHPRRRAGQPGGPQPAAARGVRGDCAACPGRPGHCPERAQGPPQRRRPALAGAENHQGGLAPGRGRPRISICKGGLSSEDAGHREMGDGRRGGVWSIFSFIALTPI